MKNMIFYHYFVVLLKIIITEVHFNIGSIVEYTRLEMRSKGAISENKNDEMFFKLLNSVTVCTRACFHPSKSIRVIISR